MSGLRGGDSRRETRGNQEALDLFVVCTVNSWSIPHEEVGDKRRLLVCYGQRYSVGQMIFTYFLFHYNERGNRLMPNYLHEK